MLITASILQQAHALAHADDALKGLKIKNNIGFTSLNTSKAIRACCAEDSESEEHDSAQLEIESELELDEDIKNNEDNSDEHAENITGISECVNTEEINDIAGSNKVTYSENATKENIK